MAICTFSKTERRGKILVRWNERASPRRQIAWGGWPGNDMKRVRLARAVGPDPRRDLARFDLEAHAAQGLKAAEGALEARHLEEGPGHQRGSPGARAGAVGPTRKSRVTPPGKT